VVEAGTILRRGHLDNRRSEAVRPGVYRLRRHGRSRLRHVDPGAFARPGSGAEHPLRVRRGDGRDPARIHGGADGGAAPALRTLGSSVTALEPEAPPQATIENLVT